MLQQKISSRCQTPPHPGKKQKYQQQPTRSVCPRASCVDAAQRYEITSGVVRTDVNVSARPRNQLDELELVSHDMWSWSNQGREAVTSHTFMV